MSRRALVGRTAVLGLLALAGLAWPMLGAWLPDLDALLAPGGATALGLLGSTVAMSGRVTYVLLAPGLAAAIALDLALRTPPADPRVSVPPCAPSSSRP